MNDPAFVLALALVAVDAAISKLMRTRVALEELEWAQQYAPELLVKSEGILKQRG